MRVQWLGLREHFADRVIEGPHMSVHLSNCLINTEHLLDADAGGEFAEEGDSGIYRLSDLESASAAERRLAAELMAQLGPMVRRISLRTVRSLPRSISADDIISAGWVGMSEALRRRPAGMPDEQFFAYASYRIRGAILDYLRTLDPLSRRLRLLARRIQSVTCQLTNDLGRQPDHDEVAARMGLALEELQRTLLEIQESGLARLDNFASLDPPSAGPSPEHVASQNELLKVIAEFMSALPKRLQLILQMHYEHEQSLRQIGEVLGVTESRVCQLHAEAIQKIRAKLDQESALIARRRRAG